MMPRRGLIRAAAVVVVATALAPTRRRPTVPLARRRPTVPLTRLQSTVDVSALLYEERERGLEKRGEFEEALMGEGGAALEASADAAASLVENGVARVDGALEPAAAAALKTFVGDELERAERDVARADVPTPSKNLARRSWHQEDDARILTPQK